LWWNDDDDDLDGDEQVAPKGVVLAGWEPIPITEDYDIAGANERKQGINYNTPGSDDAEWRTNGYYLRSEIQGGVLIDFDSVNGGALSWTLYPIEGMVSGALPSQQFVNFASLIDDYDGSNNIKTLFAPDNSYGMDPATTEFQVLVFNNEEELAELPPPDVPVSPPPPFEPLSLVINVECISAYSLFEDQSGSIKFGDFSVEDLYDLGGSTIQDFLAEPVGDELGPGWVRFDRIDTRPDQTETSDEYNSFFVGGQSVVRFQGFGISWWLPVSANDIEPEFP
jgi:hypothetical protein